MKRVYSHWKWTIYTWHGLLLWVNSSNKLKQSIPQILQLNNKTNRSAFCLQSLSMCSLKKKFWNIVTHKNINNGYTTLKVLFWCLGQQPVALKEWKEGILCFQSLWTQVSSLLKAVASESISVAFSRFVSGIAKLFFPGSQECVCTIWVQWSEQGDWAV